LKPNMPHKHAASSCSFHSRSWSASSGSTTSRGTSRGQGRSCHRQNVGAVTQVTRAIVVVSPSCRMVSRLLSAGVCGTGQVEQSAAPSIRAHRWPESACSIWRICAVRKPSRSGVFGRPSVATEIHRWARLIFTASSAGSDFIASATVRVRHNTGSDAVAVADWVAAFISDQLYSFPPRGQSGVFKQNCWLSTPFHKYGHVCDEGFLAQTRRERRAYPSGVCKE